MDKKFLLFALLYHMFSFISFGQTGVIEGHIHDINKDEGLIAATVILNETDNRVLTDLKGNFRLNDVPIGKNSIRISYIAAKDTILNIVVNKNETTYLKIEFPPKCEYYKKNKLCPKCGKKDKVIPIVYGYPSNKLLKMSKKKKVVLAGCEITFCDPNWYCKRDELEF